MSSNRDATLYNHAAPLAVGKWTSQVGLLIRTLGTVTMTFRDGTSYAMTLDVGYHPVQCKEITAFTAVGDVLSKI